MFECPGKSLISKIGLLWHWTLLPECKINIQTHGVEPEEGGQEEEMHRSGCKERKEYIYKSKDSISQDSSPSWF